MPTVMPMTINVAPETPEDEPVSMVLNYAQTAPVMRASGSAEALQYDYAADSVSLTLAGLKVGSKASRKKPVHPDRHRRQQPDRDDRDRDAPL